MLPAALVFLVAVTAGLAGLAAWQRRQFDRQLAEAEMRRLRTQLNPHFLFNTLNAISELGYNDPEAADRMITQLSGLLRKSLDEGHQQEIALRDELDFLNRYLAIQKLLLRDRLVVTFDIGERTLNARVPGMIVQPLAENALTHGAGRGGIANLHVSASRDGENLVVAVEDRGPGLDPAAASARGIGLANIRARLKHLYGGAGVLELRARAEGGLMARLTIPFHEAFAYDEAARAGR